MLLRAQELAALVDPTDPATAQALEDYVQIIEVMRVLTVAYADAISGEGRSALTAGQGGAQGGREGVVEATLGVAGARGRRDEVRAQSGSWGTRAWTRARRSVGDSMKSSMAPTPKPASTSALTEARLPVTA